MEHIDGKEPSLKDKFSWVGSLSSMSLHTRRDLEGGISLDHISLAQGIFGKLCFLNSYAYLRDKLPVDIWSNSK